MIPLNLIITAVTGLFLVGVGANEASHGGFAETMGLGHQHMFDYGGYHCASPDSSDWQDHVEHMHGGANTTADQWRDHCGNDHMGTGPHHGFGNPGGMT